MYLPYTPFKTLCQRWLFEIIPNREEITSFHSWLFEKLKLCKQSPASEDFAVISICCALWTIWKQRSSAIFDKKEPNPIATILQVNSLILDLVKINEDRILPRVPRPPKSQYSKFWRPPRPDYVKINTDAGFDVHRQIGSAGIVARNHKGEIVFGLTKMFPASSPLIAEALAFREAAAVAVSFGIARVVIESDCLEVVRACRKEIVKREILNIVSDIHQFAQDLQLCGFTGCQGRK